MYQKRWWLVGLVLVLILTGVAAPGYAQESAQIDAAFARYYWRGGGVGVLGLLESTPLALNGRTTQYFEKARLEDHKDTTNTSSWTVMYGRVVAELMESAPATPIGGTDRSYGDLTVLTAMQPAPAGFTGGTKAVEGGMFVPVTPDLSPGPGQVVPDVFWAYLVNHSSMPGGWLHDLGLPLTSASTVNALKPDGPRAVLLQAFERGILTYDPANPPDWQVERANVGTDALLAQGLTPLHAQPVPQHGARSIEVDLSKQWLYAYEGDVQVFNAPVSTGRNGFDTPTGTFAIYSKYLVRTMRGSEKGETWEVPNVPHAMYFLRGYALHGAYWHNRFGTGERRSHGCVNLPLDAAEWLYAWAPIGTPVIITR